MLFRSPIRFIVQSPGLYWLHVKSAEPHGIDLGQELGHILTYFPDLRSLFTDKVRHLKDNSSLKKERVCISRLAGLVWGLV